LRIGAATLVALSGLFAFMLATREVAATGPGTVTTAPPTPVPGPTAATSPSIDILHQQPGLAGTCGGSSFDLNTFINIGTQGSADVKVSAPSVGILEEFTDETGKNIGPYNATFPGFQIPAFGGGLAPNTLITVVINTFTGPTLSGTVSFTSALTFNCTTGERFVLAAPLNPTASIPTLSLPALIASITLVALLGAAALRRPRPARQKS
jgi:hypothetical protein